MRNFKILATLLFLGISISYAQQRPAGGGMRDITPATRAKNTVERLHKELNLSQSQQDSIYNYTLRQAEQQKARFDRSKESKDREVMRKEMQAHRAEHEAKIKSFLTDEQKAKYEKLEKLGERRRPEGRQ